MNNVCMGNLAENIEYTESVVVDIRGVSCCMPPVGEFIIEMRQQPKNTVIELLTDKEEDVKEVIEWIKKVHQELLSVIEETGYWRIFAKKVDNM
ncbi:MAG: sulfurtransferase TusA family protein [Candidatus Acidulodesulfobacterium ferriphilum]|jgi:SirA-like protein.|uniref:Sulfurtransferase TusA family protein n=1 Tax=Candidatus Acidulodesulfobacterium ferriphilum TaxID=2597223 RepID=A0A519BA41_9DELT|nr:MAG: sulfurtransferase TusA family protein [Candidatus Acidulodesulfobacterium ferriphilum]